MLPDLRLDQFQYDLPDERIARFPLPERDQSKLLVYKEGQISHRRFYDLPDLLPANSFLVFNNTKVIPARLLFTKSTGATIELFLLNPMPADRPVGEAMLDKGSAVWQCMIGNRKKWREGETLLLTFGEVVLIAEWEDAEKSLIRFTWQPDDETFAELIEQAGQMPLPPYLKREPIAADSHTYQTVYAKKEGAVAAPTAGLHMTKGVLGTLAERGIGHDALTLHVGAGTFQPIKADDPRQHIMHAEQVVYTRENITNVLKHLNHLIPVGTTSMRSLESLYWFGVRLMKNHPDPFYLDQEYAYNVPAEEQPSASDAIETVRSYMEQHKLPLLTAHTAIYITPGYQMKMCKGIVTNFHQPGSTLILLIAALVGDAWRTIYTEALSHDYRFLSYGDSSLLLP
ncbi:S-adenosylmethionine:tRNA ribosyltransferase-isomerase [Fibrella forsythiae]|uniref:S-adenosylmethionine:tRNA ribosyltransferase-isomerase n=1 Tax=Fibrella forsythiae TaxID=2817061 RepID=A0ABS3JJW3_9BACT|nr:S-adenosylmethionine:tRNA ribosyltransferase-isomerase [Fibrella forsythiae]MBO0949738.1 S-adenosylmethionine:tRNA ribosyltransferase-isomerase [Fibrella forsythiae]